MQPTSLPQDDAPANFAAEPQLGGVRRVAPATPERRAVAQEALRTVYATFSAAREAIKGRPVVPWRAALSPTTRLPAYVAPCFLEQPFPDNRDVGYEVAYQQLADTLVGRAIAGAPMAALLEAEFRPVLDSAGGEARIYGAERRQFFHFAWQQYYRQKLPVLGGAVGVHVAAASQFAAVTSGYLPMADDLVLDPEDRADDELWDAARAAFVRLFARYLDDDPLADLDMWALMPRGWRDRLRDTDVRNQARDRLIGEFSERLHQDTAFQTTPYRGDSAYAVTAFDAQFAVVQRVLVTLSGGRPWYVDLDVTAGRDVRAVTRPWPAYLSAFYQTSGEAAAGAPSGLATTLNFGEFSGFATLRDLDAQGNSVLRSDVDFANTSHEGLTAVYAASKLKARFTALGFDAPAGAAINVVITEGDSSWFTAHPVPTIELTRRDEVEIGLQVSRHQARDPEVIMHEMAHALLFQLNPIPWDVDSTTAGFGRALQEGYATYLARSSAALTPGEDGFSFARAAFAPQDANMPSTLQWGNRWALQRPLQTMGEDYLPVPNMYAFEPTFVPALQEDAVHAVYDVGMVWARALWELRAVVGADAADALAIHSAHFLAGYTSTPEVAAEAIIFVAAESFDIDLANGFQHLWQRRGLAASQAIHGLQASADGQVVVAVGDQGVLSSQDGGSTWVPLTQPVAGEPNSVLRGATGLAFDGTNLRVSARRPPAAGTGADAHQWDPGLFDLAGLGAAQWQRLPNWDDRIPHALVPVPPGAMAVATNQGVVMWSAGGPGPSSESFVTIALGVGKAKAADAIIAADLTRFRFATPQGANWKVQTTRALPLGNMITTLAIDGHRLYAGSLAGLFLVDTGMNWTPVAYADPQVAGISVTAVAFQPVGVTPARVWVATAQDVLGSMNDTLTPATTAFTGLGLPTDGAVVTCMLPLPNARLLVGTFWHGIWLHDGTSWAPVYPHAAPAPVRLDPGILGVVPLEVQQAGVQQLPLPAHLAVQSLRPVTDAWNAIPPVDGNSYALNQGHYLIVVRHVGQAAHDVLPIVL